jgi:Fe-S cluster assembly iron-binding protein IscA
MAYVLEFVDEIQPKTRSSTSMGSTSSFDSKSLIYLDGTSWTSSRKGERRLQIHNPIRKWSAFAARASPSE